MLGRNSFTKQEINHAKAAIAEQLATYHALSKSVAATKDKKAIATLAAFEAQFFNNLLLALDRSFVHRIRAVAGKDGNPLNEVEMIVDSLMNHDGVLQKSTVLKFVPDDSVSKLNFGDTIGLTAEQFDRLSAAFFDELERKFL